MLCALLAVLPTAVSAAITGQLTGTVVDGERKPVAGVRVAAASESGVYRATTDATGRFSIIGVVPDTYTVTFEKSGFAPQVVRGVTIQADVTQNVPVTLGAAELRTVARVRAARSASSAFQVGQTEDSYVVGGQQLTTILGKDFNVDQKSLLSSLPSVTVDNKGGIFIRGGFAFQVGYQYEGIDYTEPTPSLQDSFSNVGNFDQLSGISSVQIIPGGGDATHGNSGTGLVAFQAKRGRYPGFGLVDAEVGVFPYYHQFAFEYGLASRDNRLSNYFTYTGIRQDFQYGPDKTPGLLLGYNYGFNPTQSQSFSTDPIGTIARSPFSIFRAANDQQSNTFLDNLVYKFGKNNAQSLQFFLQSQVVRQGLLYGADIGSQHYYSFGSGPNVPLYPGQGDPDGLIGSRDAIYSPFEAYKFEYSNSLDATTFLTARFYRTFNNQIEDEPTIGTYVPANGGIRTVGAAELSKQFGRKHFTEVGGTYGFTKPFGAQDLSGTYLDTGGAVSSPFFGKQYGATSSFALTPVPYTGFPYADYLPPATPGASQSSCPLLNDPRVPYNPVTGVVAQVQPTCGYLLKYVAQGVPSRFPSALIVPTVTQQTFSLFAQDSIDLSSAVRATLGLRVDGYNFQIPDDPENPQGTEAVRHQRLYEPHLGVSDRLGARDSLRFTYGRTLSIPLASLIAFNLDRSKYAPFANVPSYDNLTQKPATYCGLKANALCKNYADQLYWVQRDYLFPQGFANLASPLHGATYTNYDVSYAHDFGGGVAAKITPFFRRGYDVVEAAENVLGYDPLTGLAQLGAPSYSNLGIQKATGVEFEVTKLAEFGLSGTLSATYLNQLGNDVPGGILTQPTLALGNLYRSPNFSPFQTTLAGSYKSRSGLRINPIERIDIGYPIGVGGISARELNGSFQNLPNTNLAFGPGNAYYFVDPQNPGTYTRPNVAATRSTIEGAAAGSILSQPRFETDLTVEYKPPQSRTTYGLAISNLFNQIYGIPVANPFYHNVVSTGVTGPYDAYAPFVPSAYTRSPYLIFPNSKPLDARFYLQIGL